MRAGRLLRGLVAAALALGGVLTVGAPAHAGDPDDIPLTVQVKGTTASPGPGSSTPSTGRPGGAGGSTPEPSPSQSSTDVVGGDGSDGLGGLPLPAGKDSIDGILAVGGLRTTYRPEADPFAGTLHIEVSIQNLSDETIESTIAFSLTSWARTTVDEVPSRPVGRLAPGELRTAEVDLEGIGQWGLVSAHMVLTPPALIGDTEVGPVHRDRWLGAPPWFVLGVAAFGLVGVVVWRLATRAPAAAISAATGAPPPRTAAEATA